MSPDLAPIPVGIKREFADELSALAALVDEGLVTMTHGPDWCGCSGTALRRRFGPRKVVTTQ